MSASAAAATHDRPEAADYAPSVLDRWTEFHRQVDLLPDDEREAFNLLWYEELAQTEAARVLGVSERTLQRRWESARLKLFEGLARRIA